MPEGLTNANLKGYTRAELAEASDSWEEYSIGNIIKRISAGDIPIVGEMGLDGTAITAKDIAECVRYAQVLQEAAIKSTSSHSLLYRGEIFLNKADVDRIYKSGKIFRTKSLTATSNNQELALKYTDRQFAGLGMGEEYHPVLLRFSGNKGILKGFDRPGDFPETILPAGGEWRVGTRQLIKVGDQNVFMIDVYRTAAMGKG